MRRTRPSSYLILGAGFILLTLAVHLPYLKLPFFWDELGQFVPQSLDLLRDGAWIPHSTTPNVHPPCVEAYVALVWRLFGYSIPATRLAMLVVAGVGSFLTFLLTIRLARGTQGAPAFTAVLLLLATPLFYTQAMMAQLDMPAMTLTALALLLFLEEKHAWAAAACTLLVLVKETGLLVPVIFAAWLALKERRFREACYLAVPVAALAAWLIAVWRSTGHILGDSQFAYYNVWYNLHAVRLPMAFLRRLYFLFVADFRWIGAIAMIAGSSVLRGRNWSVGALVAAAHVAAVSMFGGATLERYLLPALPVLYSAMAAGASVYPRRWRLATQALMVGGLVLGLFWNPPYPFPFENNLAMADFVALHQTAAQYVEERLPGRTVATAWPLTDALRNPDFGYVRTRRRVIETRNFTRSNIDALDRDQVDALVVYSLNWESGVLESRVVDRFLREYYGYEPPISTDEIRRRLGLYPAVRWTQRGQWVEVYLKGRE